MDDGQKTDREFLRSVLIHGVYRGDYGMKRIANQGRINWALLIVLVFAVALLLGVVVWLRHWNRAGRASAGLELGNKAFAAENWNEAVVQYGRYLPIHQDDVDILIKFAKANLNSTPFKPGNLKQATDALNIALRQDASKCPEDLRREAANLLVEIYLETGMAGEAEVKAAEQLKIISDKDLQRKMALACLRQRKYSHAIETLTTLIQQDPSDIPSYALLAQIAEQPTEEVKGLPPADQLYDQIVSKNPASAQAYTIRAGYWMRKGDKPKAMADLDKAESCDLSKPADRLSLTAVWINIGDLDKARGHLEALNQTETKNLMYWNAWAELARRGGNSAEMVTVAEKALNALPKGAFLSTAAELYILAGDLEKAQTRIEDLRKIDLSSGQADYLQGLLAEKNQQWSTAIQFWQKAVGQGYNTETAYLKLAQAYEQMGDTISAVQQLKALIRENEKSFLGQINLARLLAELGRTEEANTAIQAAIRLVPTSAEARMIQTQVRLQMMQKGLVPDDTRAWEAVAKEMESLDKAGSSGLNVRLLRMQAAVYQQQWEAASKILEGLKKDFPDEIRVAFSSVDFLLKRKQVEPAIAELRQIVQKNPQSLLAVQYLARQLALQKQTDAAIAVLNEGIDRFTSFSDKRDLLLMLNSLYAQTGQSQKGYERLRELAAERPDDILLKREMVPFLLMQNKPDEAQAMVDSIKKLEGENGWQWRFEQALLGYLGKNFETNYPKIVPLLKENLVANPDDQASRMLLGKIYQKGGDKQLALSTFREALTRDPDNLQAIAYTAAALNAEGKTEQAREILDQAEKREIVDPLLDHIKVQSLMRQGNYVSAADQLKNMLAQNPDNQQDRLALAEVLARQKQYDQAEQHLTEILKIAPDSLDAASLLIDIRMVQNRPDDALAIAGRVVDSVKSAQAYLLRGRLYLRIKQVDQAKADMLKAVELAPDKTRGWIYQVDFYQATGDIPQSIKAVKEALALSPDDLEVVHRAIILLQASPDPADAGAGAALLEKSLTQFPKDPRLILLKSRLLLASRTKASLNQAIEVLKTLTREQPNVEEAWVLMAQAYLSRSDTANALETTLRGLANLPQSFALMMTKAACEGYRNRSLAIPTYQLICRQFPESTEAALSLINAYLQANDARSALELLEVWKKKPQGSDQPRFELATAAATWQSGDTAAGQKLFDALYAQRPDDPAVLVVHAESLARGQKWTELVDLLSGWFAKRPDRSDVIVSYIDTLTGKSASAVTEAIEPILRRMIEIKPDSVDALAAMGTVLQSSGRFSQAQPFYEKAIQLDPERVIVLNNLAWILSEELKQYDRALQLVDQAIRKRADYFDAYDTRGVIYFRLNQLDKSLADLTRCVEEFPAGSAALTGSFFHQGRTLAAMQRKVEAMQSLRKALDLNTQTQSLSQADIDEAKRLLEELSR